MGDYYILIKRVASSDFFPSVLRSSLFLLIISAFYHDENVRWPDARVCPAYRPSQFIISDDFGRVRRDDSI